MLSSEFWGTVPNAKDAVLEALFYQAARTPTKLCVPTRRKIEYAVKRGQIDNSKVCKATGLRVDAISFTVSAACALPAVSVCFAKGVKSAVRNPPLVCAEQKA